VEKQSAPTSDIRDDGGCVALIHALLNFLEFNGARGFKRISFNTYLISVTARYRIRIEK